jgi:hypothetical protein
MWRERHETNIDVAAQHDKTSSARKSRDWVFCLYPQGLAEALALL